MPGKSSSAELHLQVTYFFTKILDLGWVPMILFWQMEAGGLLWTWGLGYRMRMFQTDKFLLANLIFKDKVSECLTALMFSSPLLQLP